MSELDLDGSSWIHFKNKADRGRMQVICKSLSQCDAIYVKFQNNNHICFYGYSHMYQKF